MKKIKYLFLLLLFTSVMFSCYEDKSNYDYVSVSDIVIEGLEDTYSRISLVDTLKINPQITSAYTEDELEYFWILQEGDDNKNVDGFDTISREKNLSYFLTESPGAYDLYLFVQSTSNGYYVHSKAYLEIETEYTRGHYILKETADGNTDIDLLLDDDRMLTDILLNTQGSALGGAPRSMGILYSKQMIDPESAEKVKENCLGIITYDANVNILRASDMYLVANHDEMFYDVPANNSPHKFLTFYSRSVYMCSTGTYLANATTNSGSGILGFPLDNAEGGSDHWVHLANATLSAWDETNSRFFYITLLGKATLVNDNDYPTDNYECLFMGSYSNYAYALLRDKTDPSLLYLYKMSVAGMLRPVTIESVTQISATSKMHTATLFASNEKTAQYIYFVDDNIPYYYDLTTDTEHELSFSGLPAGETITYISNRFSTLVSPNIDYLTVATYNAGNYNIYMYEMVGGLPYGDPVRVASGTGKVKETHYLGGTYSTSWTVSTYSR